MDSKGGRGIKEGDSIAGGEKLEVVERRTIRNWEQEMF